MMEDMTCKIAILGFSFVWAVLGYLLGRIWERMS